MKLLAKCVQRFSVSRPFSTLLVKCSLRLINLQKRERSLQRSHVPAQNTALSYDYSSMLLYFQLKAGFSIVKERNQKVTRYRPTEMRLIFYEEESILEQNSLCLILPVSLGFFDNYFW